MEILILSLIAGAIGTGLGGVICALFNKTSERSSSLFLSFAGGIMVSIVCFGLVSEASDMVHPLIVVLGLVVGIVIIMLLNNLVDYLTDKRKVHVTVQDLHHQSSLVNIDKKKYSMLKAGIVMLLAIALHNIPEGLAIGASGVVSTEFGTLLALMILLHNIPEGMAIASPLINGGIGRWKTIGLTIASGVPTIIGAGIGLLFGGISDLSVAICLALAGGAMLYVVFAEIIPQVVMQRQDRVSTIVLLIGIIVGYLLTFI